MPRLPLVEEADAGFVTKIVFFFTKRALSQLSARAPASMIEPLQLFAHVPGLMKGYGQLEQSVAKLDELDRRYRALAELKAATMTECEYCIDLGSQIARQWGVSDAELLGLARHRTASCFSEIDVLVLDYATAMSQTPVQVTDAMFAELRAHFSPPQLVELTFIIALENLRGRFNLALDVRAAGFSEGRVCAIPQPSHSP